WISKPTDSDTEGLQIYQINYHHQGGSYPELGSPRPSSFSLLKYQSWSRCQVGQWMVPFVRHGDFLLVVSQHTGAHRQPLRLVRSCSCGHERYRTPTRLPLNRRPATLLLCCVAPAGNTRE